MPPQIALATVPGASWGGRQLTVANISPEKGKPMVLQGN